MTDATSVPFEPGQPIVLGVGPANSRRWYRTIVAQVDARVVWLDAAPEGQPSLDVQPGDRVTCHTWRHMDALYQVDGHISFARLAPEPLVGFSTHSAERI